MSNLKHLSKTDLREKIAYCVQKRSQMELDWLSLEAEAEKLLIEAKALRAKSHNLGQIECWARYYLARKEIE